MTPARRRMAARRTVAHDGLSSLAFFRSLQSARACEAQFNSWIVCSSWDWGAIKRLHKTVSAGSSWDTHWVVDVPVILSPIEANNNKSLVFPLQSIQCCYWLLLSYSAAWKWTWSKLLTELGGTEGGSLTFNLLAKFFFLCFKSELCILKNLAFFLISCPNLDTFSG